MTPIRGRSDSASSDVPLLGTDRSRSNSTSSTDSDVSLLGVSSGAEGTSPRPSRLNIRSVRNTCDNCMWICENSQLLTFFTFCNIATTGMGSLIGGAASAMLGGVSTTALLQGIGAGAIVGGTLSVPLTALAFYCSRGWNPCPNENNTVSGLEYDPYDNTDYGFESGAGAGTDIETGPETDYGIENETGTGTDFGYGAGTDSGYHIENENENGTGTDSGYGAGTGDRERLITENE